MDYLLVFIFFIGMLIGAGFTAVVLLYYTAEKLTVEKKKLEQGLSAKLTHDFNQEKKEIARKYQTESNQAKFGRQRLVKKLDEQSEQLRTRDREIETLNYKIKDAGYALDQANHVLEIAQDDYSKLQTSHQELASNYRTQQVRLELAEARVEENQKQLDIVKRQLDQETKTHDALLFATNQLRQTLSTNQTLEKQLAHQEKALKNEVGLGFNALNGMEPVYAIRLFEAGVYSPKDMRERSPQEIASIAGVSQELATTWFKNGHST